MIVSEDTITKALTYLAHDPHPLAEAKFRLTQAENRARETYARLFLTIEGPVKERESFAECHEEYLKAKEDEAEAIFDVERHRSRTNAAATLIEVWRTENANIRAAERIR